MRKLTHIEFLRRVSNLDLDVIGTYDGRFKKIKVRDVLGIEYLVTPDKLFYNRTPSIRTAIDKNKAFEIKSRQIHIDKYCYDFVEYIKDSEKVKILCLTHGLFEQTPSNHLRGQGCPICGKESARLKYAKNGFSRTAWISYCKNENKTPSVYILECYDNEERFIKIGITTQKIHRRFWKTNMPYLYNIISMEYGTPEFTYDREKELHRQFKCFKYVPKKDFDGYRECFEYEIKGVIT